MTALALLFWFALAPAPETAPAQAPAETAGAGEEGADAGADDSGDSGDAASSDPGEGAATPEEAQPSTPPDAAEPADGAAPPRVAPARGSLAPLPPPPSAQNPKRIRKGPWRGNFWFAARADLTVPIGGSQPARGTAVAGGGTAEFGVRLHNVVGLRTALGFTVHDAKAVRVEDIYGNRFTTLDYGQLTTFEFLGVRGFLPVSGRFQPYADAAGGMVIYLPPGVGPSVAGGLFRGALGFDGWVSPHVALGVDAAYRLVSFEQSTGHAMTLSAHLSTHF